MINRLIDRLGWRRWLPVIGATVAFALVLTACGGETSVDNTVADTGGTVATASSTNADSEPTTSPDSQLATALGNVGDRYAFTATVTLDGVETIRVEGTVYDGIGAYVVTSGTSSVDYVISPAGQWARQAGGEWTVLSGPAPLADPLTPLADPLEMTVISATGDDATIEATYDGAALGFADGGRVEVTISIVGETLAEISYNAAVGGGIATVVTTFDGSVDVAPIPIPPT